MTRDTYYRFIREGIEELPSDLLAEVADFVLLVRKRYFNPEAYQDELEQTLLRHELTQLNQREAVHMEEEFSGYSTQRSRLTGL